MFTIGFANTLEKHGDHCQRSLESGDATSVIDVDVVVIGAGISGLSAAYFIQKKDAGIRLAVLEAKGLYEDLFKEVFTRQLTAV